eukprot:2633775-Prymnesium_polylepis.2
MVGKANMYGRPGTMPFTRSDMNVPDSACIWTGMTAWNLREPLLIAIGSVCAVVMALPSVRGFLCATRPWCGC